jgi:hypothetical protein
MVRMQKQTKLPDQNTTRNLIMKTRKETLSHEYPSLNSPT